MITAGRGLEALLAGEGTELAAAAAVEIMTTLSVLRQAFTKR